MNSKSQFIINKRVEMPYASYEQCCPDNEIRTLLNNNNKALVHKPSNTADKKQHVWRKKISIQNFPFSSTSVEIIYFVAVMGQKLHVPVDESVACLRCVFTHSEVTFGNVCYVKATSAQGQNNHLVMMWPAAQEVKRWSSKWEVLVAV